MRRDPVLCRKIVCVGRNYRSHVAEMKADEPSEPVLFLKPPSSLIRNGGPILLPKDIGRVDHEAELALIIGKGGKGIRVEDALGHIGQLAVFNDVTARDMQSTAKAKGLPWALSKGIDTFSPMSDPRPSGEVDDLQDLDIELRVNGVTRQRGDTSQMIFGVPELIAYISRWMRLDEGDIIATGTPEGVGPIRPGDMVEIDISEVGRLSNPVRSL
jgi:2-keto-4-pentenoate hydratase/2-oxohepta-3-ene-1,7-dioic acid hydratase in catechol pathway